MERLVLSLRELRKDRQLSPISIRLPLSIREKARLLAEKESTEDVKLSETDVYRSAILLFLAENSTDSSVE